MICEGCGKPTSDPAPESSPGLCARCYAEGWRSGPNMMAALAADPVLDVDEHGEVGLKRQRVGEPYPPEGTSA